MWDQILELEDCCCLFYEQTKENRTHAHMNQGFTVSKTIQVIFNYMTYKDIQEMERRHQERWDGVLYVIRNHITIKKQGLTFACA